LKKKWTEEGLLAKKKFVGEGGIYWLKKNAGRGALLVKNNVFKGSLKCQYHRQ
jgi:hypothetical protein